MARLACITGQHANVNHVILIWSELWTLYSLIRIFEFRVMWKQQTINYDALVLRG